jgi:hypothetical protein
MQVPPAGFVKQNTWETESRYPSNIANIKSNWWNNRAYLRYAHTESRNRSTSNS